LNEFEQKAVPLTRIQRLICQRMLQSKRTKPCFYLELKVDVTELMRLRLKLTRSFGVRVTSNAFLIRGLALAAKAYPLVLARCLDGRCAYARIPERINVGFAVNCPQGLLVPVVKDADLKSLATIARLEQQLTKRARSNKLTLPEMEGQTIALSNLGAYGTDSFLGIVPPSTSVILAVGNVLRTVVPRQGQAVEIKQISLSVAADRRVVTEPYVARFLIHLRRLLESPSELTATVSVETSLAAAPK